MSNRLMALRPAQLFFRRESFIKGWAIAALITMCAGCDVGHSPIIIDREVFVAGPHGTPNSIVKTVDGYLIVGNSNNAWAVKTDADGKVKWIFQEPLDSEIRPLNQSAFRGAIALANGSSLLCGKISTKERPAGIAYIVVLDSNGALLERRKVYPNDDTSTIYSSFDFCATWGNDSVLIGLENKSGNEAYPWLVRLDKNLSKEWEKTGDDLPFGEVIEATDGCLVGYRNAIRNEAAMLMHLNQQGEIIGSGKVELREAKLVRGINPPNSIRLINVDSTFQNELITVGSDFANPKAARVSTIFIRDGGAFGLQDGSIALFGTRSDSAPRAAIGWVNRAAFGRDVVRDVAAPTAQTGSQSYRDAVALSNNQFVAIRDHENTDLEKQGFVLSWVSFNALH